MVLTFTYQAFFFVDAIRRLMMMMIMEKEVFLSFQGIRFQLCVNNILITSSISSLSMRLSFDDMGFFHPGNKKK